jgi:hypothetical protein
MGLAVNLLFALKYSIDPAWDCRATVAGSKPRASPFLGDDGL